MSMKPGATIKPVASNTSAPAADKFAPDALDDAVLDPHIGHAHRDRDAGSITRPFLMSSAGICFST